MSVETMVFFYGVVCAAMILFNCGCIYLFKQRERRTHSASIRFVEQIHAQMEGLKETDALSDRDCKRIEQKLRHVKGLVSFDLAMEELLAEDSEAGREYIRALHPVFLHLSNIYLKRETTQSIYLLHILRKYRVCSDAAADPLLDLMLAYVRKPGIYCRSRALSVLCQTKREDRLVEALSILSEQDAYFPEKLLVSLLLSFEGDSDTLIRLLTARFQSFSPALQTAVIAYITQTSDQYSELFAGWLMDDPEDELRYALLRYFGQHCYEPVREYLYALIEHQRDSRWIDASIAASALCSYPGEKTIAVLKRGLSGRNWYVRYNAAESLEKLGVTYNELSDILNGTDRYAREMVTYRTERNNLMKEAVLL